MFSLVLLMLLKSSYCCNCGATNKPLFCFRTCTCYICEKCTLLQEDRKCPCCATLSEVANIC